MKLVKAKIYGFGKWVDQEFNFKEDYQVIFGFNEAGKTTLLNFIKSILFGFASARGENKYLQYKPKNSRSYGGELEFLAKDGSLWTIKRTDGKADGDLSLFHNDQQVPNSLMSEILGSFTKEDFEHTHVFDDRNILSIYGLDENQLETEIMSIGAVGSKEWLQTAADINDEAEEIYKKRGQKQPLVLNLKERDDLLAEKAEIENQQVAYKRVKQQLEETQTAFDDNAKLLQQAVETENNFRNLNKKWSRYEQLQDSNQPAKKEKISDEDWESVLKANQELSTLKENPTTSNVSHLDNVEKDVLRNYRENQNQLDYARNQKFELQNLQFHRDNMKAKLLKVDTQVDQLFHDYPQLSEHMQPLTSDEISEMTPKAPDKSNNLPLFVCGVAVILAFLTPNPLRVIFAVIALGIAGWYWYQLQAKKFQANSTDYSFLVQKGYTNLSKDTILGIQSTVIQLDNYRTTQNSLIDGIKSIEVDLNKWRNILVEINVLDDSYKGDNYNEQIEKYFARLDQIKAKADLAEQTAAATQKMAEDRNEHLQSLRDDIQKILDKYQIVSMNSFIQLHTSQVENQKVITKIEQDKDFLGQDLQELEKFGSHDVLLGKLDQATAQKKILSDRNNELSRQMGSLKEQMQQIFDNVGYQKLVDRLAQNKEDIIENYDEWVAKKLASQWIREMLNKATENRYPKMIEKATQYFALLTNNNYVKIDFNKKDIIVTSINKNKFDVHELSRATTIQLYISLRLAFVTEISDLITLPILIDDAFVDFDVIRTGNVFKLIQEISKNNQVLYVTANKPTDLPADHILTLGVEESA